MSKPSAAYQELRSALTERGCPLCRAGRAAGRRYLDALLFESVNDPDIRAKLAASLGFCARHHREMLTFRGERLGVAIIERALLQEALRRLQAQTSFQKRSPWDGWRKRPRPAAAPLRAGAHACPACDEEDAAAERSLVVLLQHLAGDLDQPLQAAGGLCLPHLDQALTHCPNAETQTALVRVHEAVWSQTSADLAEFIRKHDHRFRHEPLTDAEAAAIEKVMAALSGE